MCVCAHQGRLSSTWLMYIHTNIHTHTHTRTHTHAHTHLYRWNTHTWYGAIACSHTTQMFHLAFSQTHVKVSVKHTHTKPQSSLFKPLFLVGLSERLRGFRLYKTDRFRLTPSLTFSVWLPRSLPSLLQSFKCNCNMWNRWSSKRGSEDRKVRDVKRQSGRDENDGGKKERKWKWYSLHTVCWCVFVVKVFL